MNYKLRVRKPYNRYLMMSDMRRVWAKQKRSRGFCISKPLEIGKGDGNVFIACRVEAPRDSDRVTGSDQ